MIKILKYREIDFLKYKKCLETACQNSDYADRDFLDTVSGGQWWLLSYNDYEAVMPVCYVRKFGIPIVLMPKLCQQLGVFSKQDDADLNLRFYHFLNENFLVAVYAFNGDNAFADAIARKTSYFIEKNDYSTVKKNYSVHRRRNVRIVGDLAGNISFRSQLSDGDEDFVLEFMKGTSGKKISSDYFQLVRILSEKKIGHLRILRFKGVIHSFIYLFEGKARIYLSLFINRNPLPNSNIPSVAVDWCIQDFISGRTFDFMGSDVPSVAKFNERFGAVPYRYAVISNSKLTLLKNLLKSYRIITNFAP